MASKRGPVPGHGLGWALHPVSRVPTSIYLSVPPHVDPSIPRGSFLHSRMFVLPNCSICLLSLCSIVRLLDCLLGAVALLRTPHCFVCRLLTKLLFLFSLRLDIRPFLDDLSLSMRLPYEITSGRLDIRLSSPFSTIRPYPNQPARSPNLTNQQSSPS